MSRLDRYLTGRFGTGAYASDLLVAETGVHDLCGRARLHLSSAAPELRLTLIRCNLVFCRILIT
jgi:hypothetical protein